MFGVRSSIALVAAMFFAGGPGPGAQPDPEVAAAIGVWYDDGGREHLLTLASDFGDVADAASDADVDALHEACEDLKRDVDEAQEFRALPDREAQRHWAAALDHYELSAQHCVAGTDGAPDTGLLERSSDEADLGGDDMTALQDRIDEIAGR